MSMTTLEMASRFGEDCDLNLEITSEFFGDCLLTRHNDETITKILGDEIRHEIPVAYQIQFIENYLKKLLLKGVKFDHENARFLMETGERVTRYAKKNQEALGLSDRGLCVLGEAVSLRTLVITASPLDMMYAAESASFSSCYGFEGQYASSVIVMAATTGMLMVYMTDEPHESLCDVDYKHGRCWLHVAQNKVVTFKGYGSITPFHKKMIREYVQDKISEGTHLWRVKHGIERDSDELTVAYTDSASVSRLTTSSAEYDLISVPFQQCAVCPSCGDEHTENTLHCGNCSTYCGDCGDTIVHESGQRSAEDFGIVCDKCFKGNYFMCCECGCTHNNESLITDVCGHDYCSSCAENLIQCNFCEKYTRIEDAVTTSTNSLICGGCFDDNYVFCTACGVATLNHKTYKGDVYCSKCEETKGESK